LCVVCMYAHRESAGVRGDASVSLVDREGASGVGVAAAAAVSAMAARAWASAASLQDQRYIVCVCVYERVCV